MNVALIKNRLINKQIGIFAKGFMQFNKAINVWLCQHLWRSLQSRFEEQLHRRTGGEKKRGSSSVVECLLAKEKVAGSSPVFRLFVTPRSCYADSSAIRFLNLHAQTFAYGKSSLRDIKTTI